MKKYLAEFVGTFFLTLVVVLSLSGGSVIAMPILAGWTFGLLVYTIGHLSGHHFNPAVTVGLWTLKKIKAKEAAFYIIAQFIGALIATLVIKIMGIIPATMIIINSPTVFIAEMVGMIFFTFGFAAVLYGKVHDYLSGIVIGASLIVGMAMTGGASNGILNPAVAYGLNSFSLIYLLAPIVGAIIGLNLFKWLDKVKS